MADGVETKPPMTRVLSWAAAVKKAWGDQWNKKETVYQFSNGREFKSTDHTDSGIYED